MRRYSFVLRLAIAQADVRPIKREISFETSYSFDVSIKKEIGQRLGKAVFQWVTKPVVTDIIALDH